MNCIRFYRASLVAFLLGVESDGLQRKVPVQTSPTAGL